MKLNRTGVPLSRDERNQINENWETIEKSISDVKQTNQAALDYVADKAYAQVIDRSKLDWKEPVSSFASLPTNVQQGETRMVRDTGKVYRFDNAKWTEIQEINAGPVNELDDRLTRQLADKANEFDVRKKSVPIGLNDADSELLAAIQNKEGQTTFNLLSEPRPKSVTLETLGDDVNVAYVGEKINPKAVTWIDTSDPRVPKNNRIAYLKGSGTNTEWADDNFKLALNNFTNAFSSGALTFPGNEIQYGFIDKLNIGPNMTYVFDITPQLDSGLRRLLSLRAGGVTLEIAISGNGTIGSTPPFSVNSVNINNSRNILVLTVSGMTRKYYVNGQLVGTNSEGALPSGLATTTIGNADATKLIDRQYQGQIHNVLFFNRVLSDAEITSLADGLLNKRAIQPMLKYREKTTDLFDVLPLGGDATGVSYENTNVANKLDEYESRLSTLESGGLLKKKIMHLSVDDTINIFKELNASAYASMFEHPTLSFFKRMNDTYGAVFSLYSFYTDLTDGVETFNLSMMTDRFKSEFESASDWLKIGFHGRDMTSSYGGGGSVNAANHYTEVMNEVIRFAGKNSIDKVTRLGFYAGNIDAVKQLKNTPYGIVGLLSAEDTRTSYYFSAQQRDFLQANDTLFDDLNSVYFASTDLRLENASFPTATSIISELNNRLADPAYESRMNMLIIFTHEPQLTKQAILDKIESCCQFAQENGYTPDFPMYNITTLITI